MNAKVIGIVVGVIVVGAIGFMMVGGKASAPADPGADSAQQVAGAPLSLKELLSLGTSQTCTFTDGANTGVVYIAGGKVRGDFSTQEGGVATQAHSIMDGTDAYTWMDSMNVGFKVSMLAPTSPRGDVPQEGMDMDKKVDYHCSSWTVDESKFALPTDITFNDMSDMMKGMMPAGKVNGAAVPPNMPNMPAGGAQCAACDQLPTAQKDACRSALNCQ